MSLKRHLILSIVLSLSLLSLIVGIILPATALSYSSPATKPSLKPAGSSSGLPVSPLMAGPSASPGVDLPQEDLILSSQPGIETHSTNALQLSSCDAYYFRSVTKNVGAGSEGGVRKIATTDLPTGATQADSQSLTGGFKEIARFYTDPPLLNDFSFSEPITGALWLNISGSGDAKAEFNVQIFDYNPANGTVFSLGSTSPGIFLASGIDTKVTFTLAQPVVTVPAGHRLLFILEGQKSGGGSPPNVSFLYDSPARASHLTICQPIPPILSLTKTGPPGAVAGSEIIYILRLANNGGTEATNLTITDTIPVGAFYKVGAEVKIGDQVRWTENSLQPGESVEFNLIVTATQTITNSDYAVVADGGISAIGQDPVVTVISQPGNPNLSISKTGPPSTNAGELINYTLIVTNSGDVAAQNLVISDTLPAGAHYVSGGTKIGNVIRWAVSSLAAGDSLSFSFFVTATETVVNDDYKVTASNAPASIGQKPVTVQILGGAPFAQSLYLPLIIKPGALTTLRIKTENTGGNVSVQIFNVDTGAQLLSCAVLDNSEQICGQFSAPANHVYRIVATTVNCGTLQGQFNDALPGATITRVIFCN